MTETLTPERQHRLSQITAIAEETFGSPDKASEWIQGPTTALAGKTPLMLLEAPEGSRAVEHLLHRIAHGLAT